MDNDDFRFSRQLEAQLILFETQMKSCSSEIREDVRQTLKEHTLKWNSARAELQLQKGAIDEYLAKLYQILAVGSTSHPDDFHRQ